MIIYFTIDYHKYSNFLKRGKKVEWYIIRSENRHFSLVRVND